MGYGVEEPDEPVDQNFNHAIHHIEAAKIHWVTQLEMVLGHPVQLWLDVNSLHGTYALVQPFVHQAISGTITAVSTLAFEPAWREKIRAVTVVHITRPAPGQETFATLKGGILTMHFKLRREEFLPNHEARSAILVALGHDPNVPVERTQAENLELAAFEAFAAADAAREREEAEARKASDEERAAPLPRSVAGDPYAQAEAYMKRLEEVMKREKLWPGDKPEGEIEVRGAFGCENMAFTQWLAWVLMERVREIVRERGEFPQHSQVAVYARREFDGMPGGGAVADVLMDFDQFIERLGR